MGSPGNNGFVHGGGGVVVVVGGEGVVILVHRDGCAVERRYSCLKIEEANYCIILILSKRLTLKSHTRGTGVFHSAITARILCATEAACTKFCYLAQQVL